MFRNIWLVIASLLTIFASGGWFYIEGIGVEKSIKDMSHVVGIPKSNNVHYEPYQGPAPSEWIRPEDSFSYPITLGTTGPVAPLFVPLSYPFLCMTEEAGHGQPLVDNQDSVGVPVYSLDPSGKKTTHILGYSKDCSIITVAKYYYLDEKSKEFLLLDKTTPDTSIANTLFQGKTIPFVVRVEVGTINRFIYGMAVLANRHDDLSKPSTALWNQRLIYKFSGGVGIGKRQGKLGSNDFFKSLQSNLASGYAVLASSGAQTSNHYDIWLIEDTTRRLKRQFAALYNQPLLTMGVGGSGGAIIQYLLAQNAPDILDGGIAQYAYPDMITQTIYAMDCELLEHYFDVIEHRNPKWQIYDNRRLIEGLNSLNGVDYSYANILRIAHLLHGRWPATVTGSSECAVGWRALAPLVHNPRAAQIQNRFVKAVTDATDWTYWDNLKYVFGTDSKGYAGSTWDNVGVQYGLQALLDGRITPEEFLHLNQQIGSWKAPDLMRDEFYRKKDWYRLDPWSSHNITKALNGQPAPRAEGDVLAMAAARRSGQVFLGKLTMPVIDVRHYLESELNMHHLNAAFQTRTRILNAQGDINNQIIWVADKAYDPTPLAISVMDQWLSARKSSKAQAVDNTKPLAAIDSCFNAQGEIIAKGAGVWNGPWNQQPKGECLAQFPAYSDSRLVAGARFSGDVFKCSLQTVAQAIAKGLYGKVNMQAYQQQLQTIFPTGVCDYTKAGY